MVKIDVKLGFLKIWLNTKENCHRKGDCMDWRKLKEKAMGCRGIANCSVFLEMERQSKQWGTKRLQEGISKTENKGSRIDWKKLRGKAKNCNGGNICPVFVEMERQSREKTEKMEGRRPVYHEELAGRERLPELSQVKNPKEILPQLTQLQKPKEIIPQLAPVQKPKEFLSQPTLSQIKRVSVEVNKTQQQKEEVKAKISEERHVKGKESQSGLERKQVQQKDSKEEKFWNYFLGALIVIIFLVIIAGVALFFSEKNKRRLEAEERAKKESEAALAEKIAAIPAWTPIRPVVPVQSAVSSAHTESVEQPQKSKEVRKTVSLKKKKKVPHAYKVRHKRYCRDGDDFSDDSTENCVNETSFVAKSSRRNFVEHAYLKDGNKLVIDYRYTLPWNPRVEVFAKTLNSEQTLKQQVISSYVIGKRLTINLAESCPKKTVFEVGYWQK